MRIAVLQFLKIFVASLSLVVFPVALDWSSAQSEGGRLREWLQNRRGAEGERGGFRKRLQERRERNKSTDRSTKSEGAISFTDQGVERHYVLHVPASVQGKGAVPLVLAFHGGHGSGAEFSKQMGLNDIAQRAGFVAAYPDASTEHWNDGRSSTHTDISDVKFVEALIDHIAQRVKIDRKRIYATGHSNGGFFTGRLACELSHRIAAFAQSSSTMPVEFKSRCRPGRPVPIIFVNGTEDTLVPWNGGEIKKAGRMGKGGAIIGSEEVVEFWVKNNGCNPSPSVSKMADRDPDDGTTVEKFSFTSCQNGADVTLYKVHGGGHGWAGSTVSRPILKMVLGNISQDINAGEVAWTFFSRYKN